MAISNFTTGLRPGVCTSLSRPTAPYEGQVIYETDTDKTLVWNGSAWFYLSTPQATEIGIWETYIPVIAQNATITKLTNFARYSRVNKLVTFTGSFGLTGTGTAGFEMNVFLPINNANPKNIAVVGSASFYDISAGRFYNLVVAPVFADRVRFLYDNTNNYFGVTPSLAIANGDELNFMITYEAA